MADTLHSGGGSRGPQKVDPRDRAQLALSPVEAPARAGALRAAPPGHRHRHGDHRGPRRLSGWRNLSLLKAVFDDALPHNNIRVLLLAVGGMLAVTIATSLLGVVQTWMSTKVGQRVMHRLRSDVFAHLQRQSLSFFTRTRGGEVQSRIIQDIGGMQSVVTSTATSIAANLTTRWARRWPWPRW
ncbi:MAG: ABC transporter transmembrane domain-containing protein [Dermatophilaceae bacterium]